MSVGGAGGDAGTSGNLIWSRNAKGSSGGDSGDLIFDNYGELKTFGNYSRGVQAQSIGGGGGSGGDAYGLLAVGGKGGLGGTAGTVTVRNFGSISTYGINSGGVFAQSVGGSGGEAGNAGGLVALGGEGSNGGKGNDVNITNEGLIRTSINISPASTTLKGGHGIFAQSVGGGGGNGGSSVALGPFFALAIGGKGDAGGAGGDVDLNLSGQTSGSTSNISTTGNNSFGLFGQSVGGGGGNGGGSVAISAGLFGSASIVLGGEGSEGGAGGEVKLDTQIGRTSVKTTGEFATGVFLQSVGGVGGSGGYSTTVAASGGPVGVSLALSIGGKSGNGGDGGLVVVGDKDQVINSLSVDSGYNGSIQTSGQYSPAFVAQSVGAGSGRWRTRSLPSPPNFRFTTST